MISRAWLWRKCGRRSARHDLDFSSLPPPWPAACLRHHSTTNPRRGKAKASSLFCCLSFVLCCDFSLLIVPIVFCGCCRHLIFNMALQAPLAQLPVCISASIQDQPSTDSNDPAEPVRNRPRCLHHFALPRCLAPPDLAPQSTLPPAIRRRCIGTPTIKLNNRQASQSGKRMSIPFESQ